MALTNEQLISLGFKPSIRGKGGLGKNKKYDSLVLRLNESDFLYTGYNPYKKQINYKTIWKSFKNVDGERITYQVVSLADTGFYELKNYIETTVQRQKSFQDELSTLANLHSDSVKEVAQAIEIEPSFTVEVING